MWPALIQFLVSAAFIVAGGIGLTYAADAISRATGLGQLLAGALLISTATSLPDLVVGISAARNGWADLIVGDLLGAALTNLAILAALDLLQPSRGRMLSQMAAAHALSGTMSMTLLAIAGMAVFLPERLNATFGGIGVGLWAAVGAYFLGLRLVYLDQRMAARQAGLDAKPPDARSLLLKGVAGYAMAAGVILLAGPVVAHSANRLAELSGLGNTFFGTVFVPLCTTLPELVVGITAVRMRAFPLAVSNAFGSIAFNVILLAPVDLAFDGSLMGVASQTHVVTCFAAILITAIAVMGQLYHAERRIHFVEPDAMLILALIACALIVIYHLR
jgi:cation:H+ antiporter